MELPEIKIRSNQIEKGIDLLEFLTENKLTFSKSEARRTIANNGLKINNLIVNKDKKFIEIDDFKQKILKISFGKKKHYLVKII